jgi:Uma2 family endonuclease
MGTKAVFTVQNYIELHEPDCTRHELSEGELIVTPSANYYHNEIRDRVNALLNSFVRSQKLGGVISEMDFKLVGETVRRPDVAFITAERLRGVDLEKVPLAVAPSLVIEIVSKNDPADDLNLKVSQYLSAGTQAVWLIYPKTRLAYRYLQSKLEPEVRSAEAGHTFEESELLPGLSIALTQIFE